MNASSEPESTPQRQIGELMTELGLITDEQLATVLEVQQRSKRPLGQIVVELGFASGAAVAHALAMQSGGALRTEYGYALGVSADQAERDARETRVGLPKLRLAATAVPPIRIETDQAPAQDTPSDQQSEQAESVEAASGDEPDAVAESLDAGQIEVDGVESLENAVDDFRAEPEESAVETKEEIEPDDAAVAEETVETEEEIEPDDAVAADEAAIETEEEVEPNDEIETEEPVETEEEIEPDDEVAAEETVEADPEQPQVAEATGLAHLQEEVERLERALADAHVAHEQELVALRETHDRAASELERLQAALSEAQTAHQQDVTRLHDEHQHATSELESLQPALANAQAAAAEHQRVLSEEQERHAAERRDLTDQSERLKEELEAALERVGVLGPAAEETDRLREEVERLKKALGEAQSSAEQQLTRLREEQEQALSELEQVRAALGEAHEHRAGELAELSAHRDGLQQELGATLEQLAELGPVADERDRLRTELEQVRAALSEAHEHHAGELAELSAQRDGLQQELRATLEQLAELGHVADERDRLRTELEQVGEALGEAHEHHAGELAELSAQRDRLQQELGATLEQLAELGPTADERDRLRTELEQIHATLAEVQESCAVEVRRVVEERDSLTAELEEAREMLQQAERVRESQIALSAERDYAVAEVERLQTVATEAQSAADEASRLLLDEQEGRHAERETAVTQRRMLEQELGDALERLAAANAAAGEREQELQLGCKRLIEALNAVRALAANLVPGSELPVQEDIAEPETTSAEPETTSAEAETEPETEPEPEPAGYSLFVPGPNGYELVPQTGVPPQAGQIVELVMPDTDEVTVYEVARSSRTLPDGDVCVYLSQR